MVTPGPRSILLRGQPRSRLLGVVVAVTAVAATPGVILRTQTLHPWSPEGFRSGTWNLSFNRVPTEVLILRPGAEDRRAVTAAAVEGHF